MSGRSDRLAGLAAHAKRSREHLTRLRLQAGGSLRYLPGDLAHAEVQERKRFLRNAFSALMYNGVEGDYVEFGCYSAVTFRLAFGAGRLLGTPRHLWAFDSFAGLPAPEDGDAHPQWTEGGMAMSLDDFHRTCAGAGMSRADYTAVPGVYATTLPSAGEPARVALAYVDCDLYSSTVEVLAWLRPRLQAGMIVALDDYYCTSPGAPSGERRALAELSAGNSEWRLVPYQTIGWHGMSFVVEPADALADPRPW